MTGRWESWYWLGAAVVMAGASVWVVMSETRNVYVAVYVGVLAIVSFLWGFNFTEAVMKSTAADKVRDGSLIIVTRAEFDRLQALPDEPNDNLRYLVARMKEDG